MKLNIDRATWHRGNGQATPFTCGTSHCGIGQYLAHNGLNWRTMFAAGNTLAPEHAWLAMPSTFPMFESEQMLSQIAQEIVRVSDGILEYAGISAEAAERRLVELYAKAGVELTFSGVGAS